MNTAMPLQETILVVDDEPEIVTLIGYHLENAGYRVSTAGTGTQAIEKATAEPPALIVLDVMLPDMSGVEVLSVLRSGSEVSHVPVLMVTALRQDADRIRGLSGGADDYLTKPFNPEELVLRVKAILRRITLSKPQDFVTTVGAISIDRLTRRTTVNGAALDLTDTEYRLLITIIDAGGGTLGRAELLSEIWGAPLDMHSRTVDVHMQRLRGKLGSAAAMIETVRGLGFRLNASAMLVG